MLGGLNKLECFNKGNKPTAVEFILYLFWDKGIGYNEFKNLPLPYIFNVVKTFGWVKEEEAKEMKKQGKK